MKTGFSYFGVRRLVHVKADLEAMVLEGATQVLHTWSEDDLSYYRDTMGKIVEESHQLGLSVYVNSWGVGRVFGGEALSELVAHNPGSNQILSSGEPVAAICPNHPAFIDYMDGWIDAVTQAGVDTVFWDEPHFHLAKGKSGVWSCRCNICRALFRDRFGADMPAESTPEVRQFRQDRLLKLLSRWTARVHAAECRNNVCLLPDFFDAGLPDWGSVAALPDLDELSTDPYWLDSDDQARVVELYTTYSRRLVHLCLERGLEPQIWMKLYRIRKGTEHFAPLAARIAYEAGIRNHMAWSWRASEWLSWLRSDDPQAAHAAMLEEFRNLKAKS